MNQTWWVSKEQLNEEQAEVISLPLDGSYLVTGPPGSGKTNLLLLRANYTTLSGQPNIAIIVYTRTLREFIASGANAYDFPLDKVTTCTKWETSLIREYGGDVPTEPEFEKLRVLLAEQLSELIEKLGLENLYEVILLDEAQDYLPIEIEIFHRLGKKLFAVADARQKIYSGDDPTQLLQNIVSKTVPLHWHYRNGLEICRFADEISRDREGYEPLAATSNYDELTRPSSVECFRCADIDGQIETMINSLSVQLEAYPDEILGICGPRNVDVDKVWAAISASEFAPVSVLQKSQEHAAFTNEVRICVSTLHSAKGLEFRTMHIIMAEKIRSFRERQKNVAYTAVTRAKTSLYIYHSDGLPGYIEQALAQMKPLPDLPKIDDVFGPGVA